MKRNKREACIQEGGVGGRMFVGSGYGVYSKGGVLYVDTFTAYHLNILEIPDDINDLYITSSRNPGIINYYGGGAEIGAAHQLGRHLDVHYLPAHIPGDNSSGDGMRLTMQHFTLNNYSLWLPNDCRIRRDGLEELYKKAEAGDTLLTVGTFDVSDQKFHEPDKDIPYGIFIFNHDPEIIQEPEVIGIKEKPTPKKMETEGHPIKQANTAIYVTTPEFFNRLNNISLSGDVGGVFLPRFIKQHPGKVGWKEIDYRDVGQPAFHLASALSEFNSDTMSPQFAAHLDRTCRSFDKGDTTVFIRGKRDNTFSGEMAQQVESRIKRGEIIVEGDFVYFGKEIIIENGGTFSNAIIGSHSVSGKNVEVIGSNLAPQVGIGDGSRVISSGVYLGAKIGANATLNQSYIGREAEVRPGVQLENYYIDLHTLVEDDHLASPGTPVPQRTVWGLSKFMVEQTGRNIDDLLADMS